MGGRGQVPGTFGWGEGRALLASWLLGTCTPSALLGGRCWLHFGEGSSLLLCPTHPQTPRVQLAEPRNLGCGGWGWVDLQRDSQI